MSKVEPLRNRIRQHKRARAGDLVPHELNPRVHSESQRRALQALYQEIGFARSLLVYEQSDGRLKIIDGHLRAELTPEELVDVEILDVTEEEARTLLLSMDPLAQLASYDAQLLAELRETVEQDSQAARELWSAIEQSQSHVSNSLRSAEAEKEEPSLQEQYLILITCESEEHQQQLLERFHQEQLLCKALVS